jgi:hypothetical protein
MHSSPTQRDRLREILATYFIVRASELRRDGVDGATISRAL